MLGTIEIEDDEDDGKSPTASAVLVSDKDKDNADQQKSADDAEQPIPIMIQPLSETDSNKENDELKETDENKDTDDGNKAPAVGATASKKSASVTTETPGTSSTNVTKRSDERSRKRKGTRSDVAIPSSAARGGVPVLFEDQVVIGGAK